MFLDLPEYLQQKVKEHLELGAFIEAKNLHDSWMQSEQHQAVSEHV